MNAAMNKAVLITPSGKPFEREVLNGLLERGCSVALPVADAEEANGYMEGLSESNRSRFIPLIGASDDEAGIVETVGRAIRHMGGLDMLIHGAAIVDEDACYDADPAAFGRQTSAALRSRMLYSRAAAAHMARDKKGHIAFLLLADSLYYADYPSSPVLNHGTIAMMKTLAKELSPFRIAVNAVTCGCYADPEERTDRKALKQKLEIHALKPYLPQPQELVAASLDWLLHVPERLVSGQNMHIGAGMDTFI
ncbi:SDR family oxidoreductase [Paenibacillus rhizovicinus]|uniref:SDR family oxidoreductase n=1 Tax=Paenibacillus rhizovicinus TaxID=2704463 RepID=A0A6C0P1A1_9BACL|nr:SDR family oxidoreductase [Paenibacillus rhizovicinus]QHW32320.1 SDR family oxidoreductase [Paenibacillus rhizovicinus]